LSADLSRDAPDATLWQTAGAMVQDGDPEDAAAAVGFAGPRRRIVVAGAGPVLPYLASLMPGWRVGRAAGGAAPDLTLSRSGGRFLLDGEALPDGPMTAADPAMAAQLTMIALAVCYMRQAPELIQVHAAAAAFAGRVVAFLGDTRAGKTNLAVHLAQLGHRLYGDDRLLLRLDPAARSESAVQAVGLGLSPRVRLPLPRDAGAEFARFVAARSVLTLEQRAILALRPGEIAPLGEAAPLGALIVLARRDGAVTALCPARADVAMRSLLSNSLAPHLEPDELVGRVAALVSGRPCFTLEYGRARAAAGLLAERFGSD
jgi:energy-coupling factor transporter ATP-binding protein EcfA2